MSRSFNVSVVCLALLIWSLLCLHSSIFEANPLLDSGKAWNILSQLQWISISQHSIGVEARAKYIQKPDLFHMWFLTFPVHLPRIKQRMDIHSSILSRSRCRICIDFNTTLCLAWTWWGRTLHRRDSQIFLWGHGRFGGPGMIPSLNRLNNQPKPMNINEPLNLDGLATRRFKGHLVWSYERWKMMEPSAVEWEVAGHCCGFCPPHCTTRQDTIRTIDICYCRFRKCISMGYMYRYDLFDVL